MSRTETMLLEVNEFVREILDESICDEKLAKLEAHLVSSSEARIFYEELLTVHVGLELKYNRQEWEQRIGIQEKSEFEPEFDFEHGLDALDPLEARLSAQEKKEKEAAEREGEVQNGSPNQPNQTIIGMIGQALPTTVQDAISSSTFFVGSVLLSLSLFVLMIVLLIPSSEMQHGPIASISQTLGAVWASDSGDASDSGESDLDALHFGQRLNLESGLAQVKYQNGVRVNLEGPSLFVVSGANQGILVRGKVSVLAKDVPAGFTIKTPVGKVIDLGTEFGVKVADNQDTEVQVFDGLVKLEVSRPDPRGAAYQNPRSAAYQNSRGGAYQYSQYEPYQNGGATMPAQSLELCKGEAVHVDAMLRIVRPVSYLPDQFARTYQALKSYYFDDFSIDTSEAFIGTYSVWGEEEGVHGVADGSLVAEVESCAYSIFSRDMLLGANEVLAVDVPATKPGLDIFVIVSTAIGEPQGGPDGGIGFRLRRDHGRGIVVQQSDSSHCFPLVLDASQTDDPIPDQPLRIIVERSSETEFTFYYEIKGNRTKIHGPVQSPELAGVERLYIGFEVSNRDIHRQSVTFDNFSIRSSSK